MGGRSGMRGDGDVAAVTPPTWTQGFVALAGVVLLIGPTLMVLWPH